jgi:hypothetical protein
MTVHAVWAELESFEEETLQYITVECIKNHSPYFKHRFRKV